MFTSTVSFLVCSRLNKQMTFSWKKYWQDNGKLISEIPGLEVIKLFSCSTQLSMKFILLINVKMPTIVCI